MNGSATADDRLPFAVLVPDSGGDVIDVYEQSAALRLAIVNRSAVRALDTDWDRPGVYLLLDRPDGDGAWGAYAGKAPAGVRDRLRTHLSGKDHWYRAILIQRDTTHGFTSAHAAWLEGRLYDLLDAAADATLHNRQRPVDSTLPAYELLMLEAAVDPISRLMRLIGHDPATPDEQMPVHGKAREPKYYGITMPNLVEAGLVAPGARIVSTMPSWPADAVVQADGSIVWDTRTFETPSGAAVAVRGGQATNGWDFWAVEDPTGKTRLATLRARYQDRGRPQPG